MSKYVAKFPMRSLVAWCCIVVILMAAVLIPAAPSSAQAQPIYVQPVAVGDGDGSSWDNATTLQDALQSRAQAGDEVWVVAGVYSPGPDPEDTFTLDDGVAVYGGFAGTETSRDQRDPRANLTVLSGDIGGDDTNTPDGITPTSADIVGDNTRNIVTVATDATAATVLDGVTLTGGQASTFDSNLRGCPASCGGGLLIRNSAPTIADVRFIGNQASTTGGGLYVGFASPTLRDLYFAGNRGAQGGGMYIRDSALTMTNVTFEANDARDRVQQGDGGGLYIAFESDVTINGGQFLNNQVALRGGGIYALNSTLAVTNVQFTGNTQQTGSTARTGRGGGGMIAVDVALTLTNVSFAGNSAEFGSGLQLNDSPERYTSPDARAVLTNVSLSGNDNSAIACNGCRMRATNISIAGNWSDASGGGITTGGQEVLVDLRNSIVWGNQTGGPSFVDPNVDTHSSAEYSVIHSLIEGQNPPGAGNLDGTAPRNDPLFVAVPDPFAAPTPEGDLQLQDGSPAINAGSNALIADVPPPGDTTDLAGNPRISNDIIDLGAYEAGAVAVAFQMTAASDTGSRDDDNITNDTTPDFVGTAPPGRTVTLRSSLDGPLGTATADSTGAWQLTASEMRDGVHEVAAEVGGTVAAAINITIDTTAPTLQISQESIREDTDDVRLTMRFSEGVSGFAQDDIEVSEASAGVFPLRVGFGESADNRAYQLTLVHWLAAPMQQGQVTITVPENAAQDIAGNPSGGTVVVSDSSYTYDVSGAPDGLCAAGTTAAAAAALAQEPGQEPAQETLQPLDLNVLYTVRDAVMSQSDEGQRLIDVYYAQSPEIAQLMITNTNLLQQGVATMEIWQPSLRSLTTGAGGYVTITAEQVEAMNDFLDALEAAGSSELEQVIATERASIQLDTLVGQTINEATRTTIGVDPAQLDLGYQVYLPVVRQ